MYEQYAERSCEEAQQIALYKYLNSRLPYFPYGLYVRADQRESMGRIRLSVT